jgi:hypothetical protein
MSDALARAVERAREADLEDEAAAALEAFLDEVEEAEEAYRETHWGDEGEGEAISTDIEVPRVLHALGELARVEYDTRKGDETARYYHDFEQERPTLAVNPATGDLWIVGGDYDVTARGIVG